MSNELTLPELNPVAVYSGGLDAVLHNLATEARSIVTDISTAAGRAEIKSLAFKVAKSKTLLDEMGERLGEEARLKVQAINADRKRARDFLDALKAEVRKPLTDWEDADKQRIADLEGELAFLSQFGFYASANWQTQDLEEMKSGIGKIGDILANTKWDEFSARAQIVHDKSAHELNESIAKREKHDAEQTELTKLRAQAAERERLDAIRLQSEREERMKTEAAEKARKDAEEKAAHAAKIAADTAARELAIQKAAEDKAIREKAEAEARIVAAEAKAKADAKLAADKAKHDQEAAVEAERARVVAAAKAEAEASAERERNTKHRAKINGEAATAIKRVLDSATNDDMERLIIAAIAKGEIPHVKITY